MLLRELSALLGCAVVWGDGLLDGTSIDRCYAADLMSDVLAFSQPGALLITGLSSIQSAHTADVADMAAILYVAGKRPAEQVCELARAKGIPLLSTALSMFDACGLLYGAGLTAAHHRAAPGPTHG
jgi:predicted transcriptional regulator